MNRIKELRDVNGISQLELAKRVGTSQRNIGRWENGEVDPSSAFLIQLADYFECSIDYLVGREDDFGVVEVIGENQPLTNLQKELLHYFDKMNDSQKNRLIGYAFAMVN